MNPQSDLATGRILIRGVNWLGDAVMTTPALLRLRENFPAAHIALLTPEKLADLWRGFPAVNEVIGFAAGEPVFSIARRLHTGRFTHAIVLPNSPRSALEVFLAGIPQRIGYDRHWRSWLLTQRVPARAQAVKMRKRSAAEIRRLIERQLDSPLAPQPRPAALPAKAHQMHEYLHLMAALGADPAPLAPSLQAVPFAATGLDRFFLPGSRRMGCLIGLNPGAEYGPAKRWPVASFAILANALYRRLDCEFLILGGPGDVALAEYLRSLLPVPLAHGHVTSLAGKTRLGELMAALQACRVLVTNDTGPMHVAAALGTPVVVPFGSTSPELTGPGLPGDPRHHLLQSDAPCAPCFLRQCPIDFRCLKGVSEERVLAAVMAATGGR
jgi:heptosyltransferase-2